MSNAHTLDPKSEGGAFSEHGPWRVDRAELAWLPGLAAVRAASRAEVQPLSRPRTIPPLGRFFGAAVAVGGALAGWSFREKRKGGSESAAGLSRRLRVAFEHLGPAYIKLAQIVSSGRGLFPPELVEEFKKCRDQVPPEPFELVKKVLAEELGRPLEEVFSHIEEKPIAAASIAQVHAATLRTGESVVVKVQRPRVQELVRLDIQAMAWIAPRLVGRIPVAALANPPALVELFAETIVEELDFRLEAENMLDIARVLFEAGQKTIVVPRPHPTLVTRRMLVMERLSGFPYEQVEDMRNAGIDTEAVVRSLYIAFIEGAVIYGVFHGDLHGGNLVVTHEGKIALFDHGITGRLEGGQRLAFLRLMMTGAMNDVRAQLEAFRDLGALDADANLEELARLLRVDEPVVDPTKLTGKELMSELQRVVKGLLAQGARLPKPLMLYVKGMLFFDSAMNAMAPNADLFQELARIYGYFVQHHADRIRQDIGVDPSQVQLDTKGLKASLGLEASVESITPAELLKRRDTIRERLEKEANGG
jgi:ubiquinone biosynthesis protein